MPFGGGAVRLPQTGERVAPMLPRTMTSSILASRLRSPFRVPAVLLVLVGCAAAQAAAESAPAPAPASVVEAISEQRVRDTVAWLAADERRGRDTGSPELEAAAAWIADRFAASGLEQVQPGTWFHEFSLPGLELDSTNIELKLTCQDGEQSAPVTPVADQDVRLWRPADLLAGEEACSVVRADDPGLDRMLMLASARRPIVVEIATDDPAWQGAAGVHRLITRVRQAARPVFLVRQGVLPAEQVRADASWVATWKVAAGERADVTQRNVVGLVRAAKGSPFEQQYVVVSAHYDHVGVGRAVDGDGIYNGADDDATGTTAVLLLAEAIARQPAPRRNVLFVAFAAEERGLRGSRAFCEQPPVELDKVVADLNIEMIGRPEPGNEGKAWITGAELSDFATICGAALARTGIGLVDFPMAGRLFAASDNFSFVSHGVVAHSISAGSLHSDYHRPSDEVDRLDIPHMTRIVRGLFDVVLELANRDAAPEWNEAGKQRLERLRR